MNEERAEVAIKKKCLKYSAVSIDILHRPVQAKQVTFYTERDW